MIKYEQIVREIKEAIKESQTTLPDWVISKLEDIKENETKKAKEQIETILENIRIAKEEKKPICQDTGVPIFYVKHGTQLSLDFSLSKALKEVTQKATQEIPLRPSIVSPWERKNTGDNTGDKIPIINYEPVEGSKLEIIVFPKGAGSENMSKQKMFNPGQKGEVIEWIIDSVQEAGPKPCPPIFLGIGIGGTFDYSTQLSKEALIELPQQSQGKIRELEREILEKVNSLEIGPMGLGGKTTALDVKIKTAHCHTASLPVAINIQCWANRKAKRVFEE
ncbi:fumarate hydratase [archaeon SCG-AAA382B04]|nr:fumarate hydratase [archaeon SCG-AAA382B04]